MTTGEGIEIILDGEIRTVPADDPDVCDIAHAAKCGTCGNHHFDEAERDALHKVADALKALGLKFDGYVGT